MVGGIILESVYGYHIQQDGPDELVDLAERMMNASATVLDGLWLVDLIPSRKIFSIYCFVSAYLYSTIPSSSLSRMVSRYGFQEEGESLEQLLY